MDKIEIITCSNLKIVIQDKKIINTEGGTVLHFIKKNEPCHKGFGEIYFSTISKNIIRAWKKHEEMTSNLIVPIGKVKFVFVDINEGFQNIFKEIIISSQNYKRITVPPGIWFGFQGLEEQNIIVNLTDILHDENELKRLNVNEFKYKWELK